MKRDHLEDIYRLSPVQEGMLYHALQGEAQGAYLQQFVYAVEGDLDADALARAFQATVDRHAVLRSAFLWERAGRPLQVVVRRAELEVATVRWQAAPPEEQRLELAAVLRRDRERGLDLGAAPLLRLTLVRVGDEPARFLLWTYHHAILDGWSMALVLGEVLARYRALTGGPPFDPPPLRPFRDYIAWLERQDLAAAEAYWRRTLAGFEAPTPLPTLEVEAAGESAGGDGKQTLVLPAAVQEAIEARARRSGLTLNTLAQGAWALWLSRASDVDEAVFGTVLSGRPPDLDGVEEMVGLFINTLPTRVRIVPGRPLGEWLRELQAVQLEMRRYEYTPLSQVQAWSEVPAGKPLFETILAFENSALFATADGQPPVGALGLRPVEHRGETGYPLVAIVEPGRGLALTLAYQRRRLDPLTVRRWLEGFARLLESLGGDLEGPVENLLSLSPAERHQILFEWNDRRLAIGEGCLHQRFAAQAARTPDAIALECAGEQLTYRQLDRQAYQLARYLLRLGVGPEIVVGILLPRSNRRIVAVLGVLRAGGAYLPLDPDQPTARLAGILADAGAAALLTSSGQGEGLAAPGLRTVRLDETAAAVADPPAAEPGSVDGPEHLAYVIYTSGSTGLPKGVRIPHQAVARLVVGNDFADFGPLEVYLQLAPLGFDASTLEIWAPLLHGGRLVVMPPATPSLQQIGEALDRHGITTLWLTAPLFHQMVETGLDQLAGLRQLLVGGDVLSLPHVRAVRERFPALRLINGYGPTENTTFTTCNTVEPAAAMGSGPVPIGRPIRNSRALVLDRGLRLQPVSCVGELYAGGDGLARDYLNRPDLTADRFIPDPFASVPGARLYRTGDLARHLPDGRIEFRGRRDQQVKIRGYRIEPGEIEAALGRHPDLRQAVVVARQEPPGAAKRLVAYVTRHSGQVTSPGDLRRFLQQRLPEYMVPAVFVELDILPLTKSGKIDRARLPALGSARPDLASAFVAPRNPREERLAEIWSAVLGVDRVGSHDNFFELGGDSILSLQIVARARKAGITLTPRQLFEHQTLAELAAAAASEVSVHAEQGTVAGGVPLTPIQLWFFESVRCDLHHWNQAALAAARQCLVPAHLERAVGALLSHHDALRLRFLPSAEGWHQRHTAAAAPPFLHLDLTGLPEPIRLAALAVAAAELQTTLHLERGPLFRVALLTVGGSEPSRLLLFAHHLVIDGVSWRVLFEDLATAYERIARGLGPRLPQKTTSLKHWAERLLEHAQTPAVTAELDFWLAAGQAVEPLPRDRQTGRNSEASRCTVTVELAADETHALLRELPRAYGTRIEDVLLTAVALAFRAWTGRSRLLLDLEGHGREDLFDDVDLSRTVGWFTTKYPVLLCVEEQGALAALRSVREQLRLIPRRGIGYGLLRYLHAAAPVRARLRAMPQAEVVFNYLGQFHGSRAGAPWGPAGESAGPQRSLRGERLHLIDLSGHVSDGRLFVDWSYSAELHDRATVERLAGDFQTLLRRLIAGCAAPEIGLLVAADFPLARVDQPTLDRLAAAGLRVEDLYPLSPMQQGMLFDCLHDAGDAYVLQLSCGVRGELDTAAFAAAWRGVIDRHPILRTAFVWEGCDQPLQMVLRDVALDLGEEDWRELDVAEQERRLEQLGAERRRSFDLTRAPLIRLDLVRLSRQAWRFLWTFHHLVLDGWSMPIVFEEFRALYRAHRRGGDVQLPARRPFRDYVAWLAERDQAAAERYFRRTLAGYAGAPVLQALLQPPGLRRQGQSYGDVGRLVSAERTAELHAFARRHHLTLSILVQGVWALLLSRLSDSLDVVFGVTLAGRPAALGGVEEMVGMFINTLPVRLQLTAATGLVTWLREHQVRHAELGEYEYTSLSRIQQWCPPLLGTALFESIVVFENYPEPAAKQDESDGLAMSGFRYRIRETFPLILEVGPGAELSLRLKHDTGLYESAALADLLTDFEALLLAFLAAPEAPLASFAELLDSRTAARRETLRQGLREKRYERLQHATRRPGEPTGVGA
jgi:amino acid adenylation domain-containing protein/non-ribosomal peptide synthase protein (TIGR01720 family)